MGICELLLECLTHAKKPTTSMTFSSISLRAYFKGLVLVFSILETSKFKIVLRFCKAIHILFYIILTNTLLIFLALVFTE